MTFEIAPSSPIQVSHSPDCSFGLNGFSVANLCERLDYAFQPIVNIHTGAVFGFEALLRGLDNLGFRTVDGLFSAADGEGILLELESALRDKAIASFARIPDVRHARLLFNLDSRSLINEPRWGHLTDASLKAVKPSCAAFSLSAPAPRSNRTTSRCPFCDANIKAV